MSIYGIGACYDGTIDVSAQFVSHEVACIEWTRMDAPILHRLLSHIKVGDIIYIKALSRGRDLTIKAVGIVRDEEVRGYGELGQGVRVRWIWQGIQTVHEGTDEKYDVRSNPLYEEVNPVVQGLVLQLLFSGL